LDIEGEESHDRGTDNHTEAGTAAMSRCTATTKRTGERCKNSAILGGTVCRYHGGGAPQVKRKAEERLLDARDDALSALAHRLRRQVDALDSDLIDTRDLLASVKELSTLAELLAGKATDRIEVIEVRVLVAAIYSAAGEIVTRWVPVDDRSSAMAILDQAVAGIGGEST
jgi:hypothetical protein